jgi:hypothetical protein
MWTRGVSKIKEGHKKKPYKTKGYTHNIKTQSPSKPYIYQQNKTKQNKTKSNKRKIIISCHCRNESMMVGLTIAGGFDCI